MKQPIDGVCTTREAAEALGVSLRTIQLWVDSGVLEAWKTAGGHRRVSLESIRRIKEGGAPAASGTEVDVCKEVLLAYQPVLDAEQKPFGYELLYRKGEDGYADIRDPVAATAKVISMAFAELGLLGAMGDQICFVNIDEQMLFDDVLLTLAPGRVVLEIPAATVPTDEVVARCRILRQLGYRVLLENFRSGESPERLLPEVNMVKVDCRRIEMSPSGPMAWLPQGVDLVAGRVETDNAWQIARKAGAKYFQGFYFATPYIVRGTKISPQRATILDVLGMVVSDADLGDIEKRLKTEPAICYSLLRLANSAALHTGRRIEKLQEAIMLLGRKNLQRWLQVLLFAHDDDPGRYPNPLMLAAAFRGRFLEYLAILVRGGGSFPEKAFMVGILSYIEALLHIPLEVVLFGLHLAEEVEAALLRREGVLGSLLNLAESLDRGDFDDVRAKARALGMAPEHLRSGLIESMRFSSLLACA